MLQGQETAGESSVWSEPDFPRPQCGHRTIIAHRQIPVPLPDCPFLCRPLFHVLSARRADDGSVAEILRLNG